MSNIVFNGTHGDDADVQAFMSPIEMEMIKNQMYQQAQMNQLLAHIVSALSTSVSGVVGSIR